jgi:hypothetical protein
MSSASNSYSGINSCRRGRNSNAAAAAGGAKAAAVAGGATARAGEQGPSRGVASRSRVWGGRKKKRRFMYLPPPEPRLSRASSTRAL